jgi:tetratricopeptide (TPR) repeat protein
LERPPKFPVQRHGYLAAGLITLAALAAYSNSFQGDFIFDDLEAMDHWRKALETNPDFPDAHYNLGAAFYLQGRVQEAFHHWREVLRLQPNNVNVLNLMEQARRADMPAGEKNLIVGDQPVPPC